MTIRPDVERKRREAVEAEEEQADLSEKYEADLAKESTSEGREALQQTFAETRRAMRQREIDAGRRSPHGGVLMHQILWARWIEVAVEREMQARAAFSRALDKEQTALLEDFHASLVAISAAAHVVEALFGEIKYRIPEQPRRNKRYLELRHAFTLAFGLDPKEDGRLLADLKWLFELRDLAVHPYAEAEPPRLHPAGYLTGAEFSDFNAVTSGRSVDIAMRLLAIAETPPKAASRWIERWAEKRSPYHVRAVAPLRAQRAALPLPPTTANPA